MIFKSFLGIFPRIPLRSVSLRHDVFFFSWIQSNTFPTRRERSFLPLSGETKNSKEQTRPINEIRGLATGMPIRDEIYRQESAQRQVSE